MNEDQMKSISGEVTLNGDRKYAVTSELKIDDDGKVKVMTPMMKVIVPGRDDISLTGNVRADLKGDKTFNSDLTLSGLSREPLQLQCEFCVLWCSKVKLLT
jgi:hypothetical protein